MRSLFFLSALLLVAACARGSDAIAGAVAGASPTVRQVHVTAELVPESTVVAAGQSMGMILHLHMDPGWHTYWINPGSAGLATRIKWMLPPGWSAGPIEWPVPETHAMGPITTYGYGGDVYLPTTLKTPAGAAPGDVTISAQADWLVCQEECIPGKAALSVKVKLAGAHGMTAASNESLFAAAWARLPLTSTTYRLAGAYGPKDTLDVTIKPSLPDSGVKSAGKTLFYAEQPNVLAGDNSVSWSGEGFSVPLVQNGEKPDHLSGVLVSDQPLLGAAKAVYFASFPVENHTANPPATTPMAAATASAPVAPAPKAGPAPTPTLIAILGAAFVGGLILNLMPCVLPVLSLKVFSLIKHAESGSAWKQGLAFTAGVLVSFWALAGLLIGLESAGHHLGWGFQMQSPGFVLALTFLFFLLGLNLFGVFELGTSLVGLDAKATSNLGGVVSSFSNGALATLAATPCTAPFMGSAVGFAAQQPAVISLLVFTVLALGMASPYLALTIFPGALRLVPKPGAWMETLKQFMGFLLMGTVIFLVYVFAAQTGEESVSMLLGVLLVAAVAAWIFGRASSPLHEPATRIGWTLVALALMAGSITEGIKLTHARPEEIKWQPWSTEAVSEALAKGEPVFVDFTAAWCLSCKANEAVAINIDATKKLFADKHIVPLRGDWTNADPKISDALRQYNRDGVPLYLIYSPKQPDSPQVLPEALTPGIVRDALQKLP